LIAAAALLAAAVVTGPAPAGERIAEGVWLFSSGAGNSLLVSGHDAALVVDAPEARVQAEAIRAAIPAGVPLRWLLRTSRRGAVREGEAHLLAAGATLVATPEVLSETRGPRLAAGGRLQLHLSPDRRVELRPWPGPRQGSAIAVVLDVGLVFGGEGLPVREVPVVTSDPAGWASAVESLMREVPSGTFVPQTGKPGRALDLRFLRDYLLSLRRGVEHERGLGRSGRAMEEALVERQRPFYGSWKGFAERAGPNVARMEAIVAGEKAPRSPTPSRAPSPR
jgi:hypothetical protein